MAIVGKIDLVDKITILSDSDILETQDASESLRQVLILAGQLKGRSYRNLLKAEVWKDK